MRLFIVNMIVISFFTFPAWSFDHNHSKWTNILKEYQNSQGLVKYQKLKADAGKDKNHVFNQYLLELQSLKYADYESFSKNEKMAFLINAYNALTVKLIVDRYPVKSIKNIGGFFTKPWSVEFFSLLDGKIKSLDPIEHKWLRPHFKDFRIHAAVNCASISCPPLRNEAFQASSLDKQLDDQMKVWLRDKSRNQVDSQSKQWKLSKIFHWYKDDFKKWGNGIVEVVSQYTEQSLSREIASQVKIDYLDYDWSLNEVK